MEDHKEPEAHIDSSKLRVSRLIKASDDRELRLATKHPTVKDFQTQGR